MARRNKNKAEAANGRVKYYPRSFLWNVFAVMLAFFMGIIACLGGLFGAGYLTVSQFSIKDILGESYNEYVDENYAELSILDLITEVAKTDFTCLESIGQYTPFLAKTLNDLNTTLADVGIQIDVDELMEVPFDEIATYFQETVVGGIQLGGVLGVKPDDSSLILTLCYGKEGVDYDVVDGEIVMKEGKTPLTVQRVIDDGEEVLFDLALGDLLGITAEDDPLIIALCYGKEGVDYEIVGDTIVPIDSGSAVVLAGGGERTYPTTIGSIIDGATDILNDLELGTILSIDATSSDLMKALCFGKEGEDYTVVDGKIVMNEGKSALTIGTITQDTETVTDRVFGMELGVLLELDASADAIMLNLCYGKEGVDYDVIDGEIVMREGKTATSINDLVDGASDIINDMELGSLLNIDASADSIMLELCYGKEGEDYTVVGGKIVMNEGKSATTIADLTEGATDIINDMELGSLLALDKTADAMMIALCYGKEDVNYSFDGNVIVPFATQPPVGEGEVSYPVTVGSLTEQSNELINSLEIETVLGVSATSNSTMRYIAYGTEGINYEIVGEEIVMLEKKVDGVGTGEYYQKRKLSEFTDEDSTLIDDATIGALVGVTESSSLLMQAIQDWTLNELKGGTKIKTLKIGEIIKIDKNSSLLMQTLQNKTIDDLNDPKTISSFKIGEIVKIDESSSLLMQTLKDKTIDDLNDPKTISSFKIGEIVKIDKNSSLLMQTLQDKTIDDLNKPNTVGDFKICEIVKIDETSSQMMQTFKEWKINDLSNPTKIESLKIGEIIDLGETPSALLKAISGWSISNLKEQSRIERLKISQVVTVDEDSSALMQAIQNWRIGDLGKQEKIDTLTLSDVLEVTDSSPLILKALKNTSLGAFDNKVNELRLCDIIDKTELDNNKILRNLQYSTLTSLAKDIQDITIGDMFGEEMYSYLSLDAERTGTAAELNGLTFDQIVAAYSKMDGTGWKDKEDLSELRPEAIVPTSGALTVTSQYHLTKSLITERPTEVQSGWFVLHDGHLDLLGEEVPHYREEGGTGYYVYQDISLTPVYTWKSFNYTENALESLGTGRSVSEARTGYTEGHPTPAKDETPYEEGGNPLYLLNDGDMTYYPLLQDGMGVYYKYMDGETEVRVDLEKAITAFKETGVTLNDDGTVTYGSVKYALKENAGNYAISVKQSVDEYFYVFTTDKVAYNANEVYEASAVTESWVGSWTDEKGKPHTEKVDRYLSGVWYLLFDGEGSKGADTPVLNLGDLVGEKTDLFNTLSLWEMYLHELVDENPYKKLLVPLPDGTKNLNEMDIAKALRYFKSI